MLLRITIVFIAATSVLALEDRCSSDFTIGYLYKELGCKPLYEEASKCPSHFDCSSYSIRGRKNICVYKGETYEIGSEIPAEKVSPCVANCKCIQDTVKGRGIFSCANVECFDWHLEDENCTRLYREDNCCSVKTHCKGDGELPTCFVDGKVYVEGQKFYPDSEPCKECYCRAGFEGKFEEPYCKDVSCNVELYYGARLYDNCIPVYYGNQGCCPIDWVCPSKGKHVIIPNKTNVSKSTKSHCIFGDLELEQYDRLETNDPNIECKCLLPPQLTCTSLPHV